MKPIAATMEPMRRLGHLLLIGWWAAVGLAPSAQAGERLARVEPWKPVGGQPACVQRIEALLRDGGYRLVDESFPREKLDLVVVTQPDCRQGRDRKFYCSVEARVASPAGQAFSLRGDGTSLGSWTMAQDEACGLVSEQLANQLRAIERGVPPKSSPGCKTPGAPG